MWAHCKGDSFATYFRFWLDTAHLPFKICSHGHLICFHHHFWAGSHAILSLVVYRWRNWGAGSFFFISHKTFLITSRRNGGRNCLLWSLESWCSVPSPYHFIHFMLSLRAWETQWITIAADPFTGHKMQFLKSSRSPIIK